jgi:putative ABC transport system permease protein
MSLCSRITNVFRNDRLSREIDEEFASHLDEAVTQGRDPVEARRAFGSPLRQREASHDVKLAVWLDSLRADAVFGWRQLMKRKVTSSAAILSLALAIGACTAAFRLIDAILWRPLPVAHAERLYAVYRQGVGFEGAPEKSDFWAFPAFQRMRAAAREQAELLAVSYAERRDLTYKSDQEMEKAYVQYVSGNLFEAFGLPPAAGRVFTEEDDLKPGAHPYAVLSGDYWTRRFARDPAVVGRTLRLGDTLYLIIGVGPERFTGTETGTITDIFLPATMHPAVTRSDWAGDRILAVLKPGVPLEPLRQNLNAINHAFDAERAKSFTGMSPQSIDNFLNQTVGIESAEAGVSNLQADYRRALGALGVLVAMVLLIACANVANLMTALAGCRAREMALRVAIGAGRGRLLQLVIVESALLALCAAATGAAFGWWSAPAVVSMINPPDYPVRLNLPADWRVAGFALALDFSVMLLFGLLPALRASAVKPVNALKGGENPHTRRRLMHGMIAAQAAFCFLVVFIAGLFTVTFDRLSHRPMGFSADRLLLLETVVPHGQPPLVWEQVADRLRVAPGVEKVAIAGWPLLEGGAWNDAVVLDGGRPSKDMAYFLTVSPGWIETMKIPLLSGRDFRAGDSYPGSAIVNQAFAKRYFGGRNPVGMHFEKAFDGRGMPTQVVGLAGDAPYRDMREAILPVAYVPFRQLNQAGVPLLDSRGTFIVRTATRNPLAMASSLRREVSRARSDFRVSNVTTQAELVRGKTIRERLLAMLGLFFAGVALLLAGIGLYGVLDYSVLQRRREIGIRMAIGARAAHIARGVMANALLVVAVGAAVGLVLGMASVRYIASLLYQVKPTDVAMLVLPTGLILAAAVVAALPAVIRAVGIDPATTLRSE